MTNEALDTLRRSVNETLDPDAKAALGQFMTPSSIASFMANLFDHEPTGGVLLDCGAGVGSLTVPAAQRVKPTRVEAWEVDPTMAANLDATLRSTGIPYVIHRNDFIKDAVSSLFSDKGTRFTHVVLNPPYKKINSNSVHRFLLKKVGIETVNLYAAFLGLAVLLTAPGGQIVAIIPRSFCNGAYYKPFRRLLLHYCSIDRIHVFDSRSKAFKDDSVLQENVILKLTKGRSQGQVMVSSSPDQTFDNLKTASHKFSDIVKPKDDEFYFHIPRAGKPLRPFRQFSDSLADLWVEVSTGPVVDFRMKAFVVPDWEPGLVPLIYPHHFSKGQFVFPKDHKKPNAMLNDPQLTKWLLPRGWYVLVKRFSAKEEKRRVVAYLFSPDSVDAPEVGFENHWNILHAYKRGLDSRLAKGLYCYLNTTVFDNAFREFSGHTQVNATDLRNMLYPSRHTLERLGDACRPGMTQEDFDGLLKDTNESR